MLTGSVLLLSLAAACEDASPTGYGEAEVAAVYARDGHPNGTLTEVTPQISNIDIGEALQLVAVDADGNEIRVNWSTSESKVADVTKDGLVTGVATGQATITAKSRRERATAQITVSAPATEPTDSTTTEPSTTEPTDSTTTEPTDSTTTEPTDSTTTEPTDSTTTEPTVASVSITPDAPSVDEGETVQLSAKAVDADGNEVTGKSVEWRSSNSSAATVSSSGVVTGVSAGTAVIEATVDGAASDQTEVTVLEPETVDEPVTPPTSGNGIWVDPAVIATLPTSGAAWEALVSTASQSHGSADISDQNSNHDVYTMAAALVCVRTGEYCQKARDGVVSAIGTEQGGRWLAVGRNLTAYVIAADLLDLRADGNSSSAGTKVENWIASFLTMELAHNNSGAPHPFSPFESGSNAAAQEGAAYAAVAAYLGDRSALDHVWDRYRTYACDPTAPYLDEIDVAKGVDFGWAHDDSAPCAVNPKGTTKVIPSGLPGAGQVKRIDGAIINDMRRGGEYQWEPGYTSYPWVGLEGFVPAAVILHNAGYSAFDVADQAVLRATEYLWYLRNETGDSAWFDGRRSAEVVALVNGIYGKSFPVKSGIGIGRVVGFTDWTHSN